MKKIQRIALAALATVALVACQPDEPQGPTEVIFPNAPEQIEATLDASPEGNTGDNALSYDIEAEGNWVVEPSDDYDWIEVDQLSGEGSATLTFTIEPNATARERSAEYIVKESFVGSDGTSTKDYIIYSIFITQAKPESNLADGTYAFLRQIIDGKMLGSATPTVDNWYKFDEVIDGIVLENFDGKLEIVQINWTGNMNLVDLPDTMELPELVELRLNECSNCEGKEMPAVWNTPKLVFCNIAASGFTGTFPTGIAASEKLMTLYANNNNFYGVYPHDWASKNLQCLICCNVNNKNENDEFPIETGDNSGMGYMVPAQMDVIFNKYNNDDPEQGHCNESRDLTQMKLGGVFEGNYVGFEAGWGQHRYERFDPEAVIGDKYVWSMHRLLIDEQPQSYFSNMGYVNNCMLPIPTIMRDWDEAAADEWTKQAAAKYGK